MYYNNAVSLNYNLRWNLIGKNQWNGALAFNPHFGALFLNNPSQFIFLPLTLEYHNGMGANFDVLKYRIEDISSIRASRQGVLFLPTEWEMNKI